MVEPRGEYLLVWTHHLYSTSSTLTLLDTWRNGKFRRGKNLFPDKLTDLQGTVIRVATFDHPPSVVYVYDQQHNIDSRLGVDMQIVQILAEARNFSIEFIEVSHDELWGFELPNGTWVGLVGKVFYELADIGACNMFLELHRWKQVDYSAPYNFERGCFVAPSPEPLSNWKSPTMPFTWTTWTSIGIGLGVGGVLLHLVVALSIRPESSEFRSVSYDYLYVLGALTMRSLNIKPSYQPVRVYVGCVWLFSLILATAYSANLVAFLSVTQMSAPINTMDQLSKSSLRLGGHAFWMTQFAASIDSTVRGFNDVLETDVNLHSLFNDVETGEFALIENKQYLELQIGARYTYGSHASIRIVPECLQIYSIGLAFQKNSPLKLHLNSLILQLFESGVVHKWQGEVVDYFRSQYASRRPRTSGNSRSRPLNLAHLQGVFYVLGIGYLVSTLILVLELIVTSQVWCKQFPQNFPTIQ
ncbi:glutamate receptor ionotropic, delta-1-like [Homarus americanus]|nr:glutamate receptor ionotropic, delta-1-like [Homarus americanus]